MARTKQTARRRRTIGILPTPKRPDPSTINLESDNEWSCNEEYILKPDKMTYKQRRIRKKKRYIETQQKVEPRAHKIVSMMKLSRKLLHYTPSQLKPFLTEMMDIFDENDEFEIFIKVILNGLSKYYHMIPHVVYENIETMESIQSKIVFNDSFPNDSDESNDDAHAVEVQNNAPSNESVPAPSKNKYDRKRASLLKTRKDT
eukprot:807458_1